MVGQPLRLATGSSAPVASRPPSVELVARGSRTGSKGWRLFRPTLWPTSHPTGDAETEPSEVRVERGFLAFCPNKRRVVF